MGSDVVDQTRADDLVRLDAIHAFWVSFFANALIILGVVVFLWRAPVAGYNVGALTAVVVGQLVAALAVRSLRKRITWSMLYLAFVVGVPYAVAIQVLYTAAPNVGPVILVFPIVWIFGYLTRYRIALAAWSIGWTTAIFGLQPGWENPAASAVFLIGAFTLTAWLSNRLVNRAKAAGERERVAKLELATLNETLEARVAEQVDQLGRLDRLRRFLSPSIAEAVVSDDSDSRLAPHRAEIAAVFCDLRGFTAFSAGAEPEDVTTLLQRFHSAIGPLVDRYEATVGGFAGDGVALYFNDPIPCPDPAVRAVKLALDLEQPMAELTTEWRRLGFEVGYGVGIALGYATLGITGFEHRQEYTAIGTVMNLASRLSDEAGSSEILLDQRAAAAVQESFRTEPMDDLVLKGFSRPVQAYRVLSTTRDGS